MFTVVINPDGTCAGVPCKSEEEARELANQKEGRKIFSVKDNFKIVFCEDGIDDWQMVKIYKNNVLIDDKLENHTINVLDLLEFLSENGLFELKIEQN